MQSMLKQLTLPFSGTRRQRAEAESSDEYEPEDEHRKSEVSSLWTRVKPVDTWKATTPTVFDFEKDIAQDLSTAKARHHLIGQTGRCLFDPDEFGLKGFDCSLSKRLYVAG